jgi:protease IV
MRYLLGFLRNLWRGLDALRRVLHLLLMLALLALLLAALRSSIPRLPARGALLIHPSGELVEQLSGAPIERAVNEAQGQSAPQTLLWDLTRAIRAAAGDARIQALLIETDDLTGAGLPELEELGAAIGAFRASGKKVVAHGSYFLQGQYFLAAQADELYLDPFGFVLLPGFDQYRMYFKDALDKLAIDVHLVRAGKFKSAAEPFVRRDMSPEDRQASAAYLQALWLGYRNGVGAARHLEPEAISGYANGFAAAVQAAGGDMAEVARAAGLVTALRTGAQVEQRMIELVGADRVRHSFQAVALEDYLRVLHTEERLHRGAGSAVGVIMASGEILDGKQPAGTVGGDSTSALLRKAREDDAIKAVVLRIDSPGGSVLASEQIYREVQALRTAGKPVVASMGALAASGGYYIAAPADEILASANTITGSIGVFAAIPTFDRTLAKLGVRVDGVGTTALSGTLRLDRPLQPAVEQILQSSVNHSYAEFLQRVASARRKSAAAIDEIGQGRVWIGSDAQRLGLIDRLGGYDEAVHAAARRAKLAAGYEVRVIEPELSFGEQLLLNMRAGLAALARVAGLGPAALGERLAAGMAPPLQPLERELRRWQRLAAVPQRALAYCFCTVE